MSGVSLHQRNLHLTMAQFEFVRLSTEELAASGVQETQVFFLDTFFSSNFC